MIKDPIICIKIKLSRPREESRGDQELLMMLSVEEGVERMIKDMPQLDIDKLISIISALPLIDSQQTPGTRRLLIRLYYMVVGYMFNKYLK